MTEEEVHVVLWRYRGHQPFVDFWARDDAYDFAQRLAESPDRVDVQVFSRTAPQPDEATKQRIKERIQSHINSEALLNELNG